MNLLSELFYTKCYIIYPPFKKGLYLEEYFFEYMKKNKKQKDKSGRLYIPAFWTNFQIENWFSSKKEEMQQLLDNYLSQNNCSEGYFTVVQHDNGPMLMLPNNTIVYGCCNGTIPIPLIYQDLDSKLDTMCNISKHIQKDILCSFVGTVTHKVRKTMMKFLKRDKRFILLEQDGWTTDVNVVRQQIFINTTIKSKFALAPRGFGRSSFRYFEIIKLGTIPIYIWDDIEWLPYKNVIDYTKFSISINISEIQNLGNILDEIVLSGKYEIMLKELENIRKNKIFEMDYLCEYIVI